jgi:alpha/beta superfamily hydrolase
MPEQAVTFTADNLKLQGMYHAAASPVAGAVICHPHPLYGGSMDNNVVFAVAETLQATGHSTLRFNFRGVGRSEGTHGGGTAEIEDVRAAIEFMRENTEAVVLVGYSFGSWVAASALAGDESVSHLLLVAPPTSMFDYSTLMQDGAERARHFIVGDRDQFCDHDTLQDLFDKLPEPKSMRIIQGADHFLFGHERALAEAVDEAMADHT